MKKNRASLPIPRDWTWILFAILFQSTIVSTAQAQSGTSRSGASQGNDRANSQANKKTNSTTSYLAEYHFSLAQAYSADGNIDKAIEEYKLTLMYDPLSAV